MAIRNNPTLVSLMDISFVMAGILRELAHDKITEEKAQSHARAVMESYIETANEALTTAINDALEEEKQ